MEKRTLAEMINELVREKFVESNMTVTDFANEHGLKRSTIGNIKNGGSIMYIRSTFADQVLQTFNESYTTLEQKYLYKNG